MALVYETVARSVKRDPLQSGRAVPLLVSVPKAARAERGSRDGRALGGRVPLLSLLSDHRRGSNGRQGDPSEEGPAAILRTDSGLRGNRTCGSPRRWCRSSELRAGGAARPDVHQGRDSHARGISRRLRGTPPGTLPAPSGKKGYRAPFGS